MGTKKAQVAKLERSANHHRTQMEVCLTNQQQRAEELAALQEEYRSITDGKLSPNSTPTTSIISSKEPIKSFNNDHMEDDPPPPAEGQPSVFDLPSPPMEDSEQGTKAKRLKTNDTHAPAHGVGHDPALFGQHIALCSDGELDMYMKEIQKRRDAIVDAVVILKLRYLMFNISRLSPGFSKATFCGSSHVPRDASAVAVPGFCCFSGPDASDLMKQTGTKMPFFQVPSSGNEMAKLQNPLFQRTLKDGPHFETQVKALERVLKVRERVVGETDAAVSGVTSGKSVAGHASGADGRPNLVGLRVGSEKFAAPGVFNGNSGLPDGPVSALSKLSSVAELETSAGVRGSAAVTTADPHLHFLLLPVVHLLLCLLLLHMRASHPCTMRTNRVRTRRLIRCGCSAPRATTLKGL